MPYDSRCFDLASVVLDEPNATTEDVEELAQQIHDCIATFLGYELSDRIRARREDADMAREEVRLHWAERQEPPK
jgi:hypothetical protein